MAFIITKSDPDRCPNCRYSLQGLSLPHRCPECGLLCEQGMQVVRNPRAKRNVVAFIAWLAYFFLIMGGAVWSRRALTTIDVGWLVFMALILGTLLFSLRHRHARAFLSSDGLVLARSKGCLERYSWSSVESVTWSVIAGKVSVISTDGQVLTTIQPCPIRKHCPGSGIRRGRGEIPGATPRNARRTRISSVELPLQRPEDMTDPVISMKPL